MAKKTENTNEKEASLKNLDSDALLYTALPKFILEIMHKYFRVQVEGLENIPKKGSAIITPNHSGYSGFDAMMVMHEVQKGMGRTPKVLAHHLWFLSKFTAIPISRLGFVEATKNNGLKVLKEKEIMMLFIVLTRKILLTLHIFTKKRV